MASGYHFSYNFSKGTIKKNSQNGTITVFWNLSLKLAKKWAIGPKFHAGHFGPVTQPLACQKMSDFDSITSYGSVQVSAAQICKNFENRYVRTRDMGKKLTENGLFWAQFCPILAQSKLAIFGPIDLYFTAI